MSRFLFVGLGFLVLLISFSGSAEAAPCNPSNRNDCLGKECAPHGLTQMQKDGEKILACLKKDSSLEWKVMTMGADETAAESPPGTLCGGATRKCAYDTSGESPSWDCKPVNTFTCQDRPILVDSNPWPGVDTPNCPSGYVFATLLGLPVTAHPQETAPSFYACVKD